MPPVVSAAAVARDCALMFGAVTAVIQITVLVTRIIYVGVDLLHGFAFRGTDYGFGAAGLWNLILLFAAGAVGVCSTWDRRLWTCLFWCAAALLLWMSLLSPPYEATARGLQRSGATVVAMVSLAGLLAAATLLRRQFAERPDGADNAGETVRPSAEPWPGFRASVAAVALSVGLLVTYHLASPTTLSRSDDRIVALATAVSAGLAGFSCFLLASRTYRGYLIDAGMGMSSLCLAALATLAVPNHPRDLGERYPILLNAMIVGLTIASGGWTRLAIVWKASEGRVRGFAAGARLVFHAKRFAFLSGALALVLAALMAVWPRLPFIAAADDSFGRMAGGLAANLALLLVLLASARRLHWMPLQMAAIMAVVSTAGFVMVRLIPFLRSTH